MRYALTVICLFGSWLWVLPLPSKKSEAVAKALYSKVLLTVCIPLHLLSDRGGSSATR